MLRLALLCTLMLAVGQVDAPAQDLSSPATEIQAAGDAQSKATVTAARELIKRGRMEEAEAELDVLATQHPEPAGTERLRGFVAYQQNRLAQADASFAKALEQDPSDRESMQMRGVVLYRMGKAPQAIPLLERAHAAVSSVNVDPDYALAVCYVTVGRYDDARHSFADQYGFAPDSAPAYLITSRMLLRHELVQPAEESAHRALQIDPKIPLGHQLLGEIALARGDTATAIAELQKERELNPLNGSVYDRLGDAYTRGGQYAEARQALNRAILLEPNATGPYILLGKVLLQQEQPVMATMYLERAVQMDPANFTTHMLLGQAYRAIGRKDDAAKEFHAAQGLQAAPSLSTPQQ